MSKNRQNEHTKHLKCAMKQLNTKLFWKLLNNSNFECIALHFPIFKYWHVVSDSAFSIPKKKPYRFYHQNTKANWLTQTIVSPYPSPPLKWHWSQENWIEAKLQLWILKIGEFLAFSHFPDGAFGLWSVVSAPKLLKFSAFSKFRNGKIEMGKEITMLMDFTLKYNFRLNIGNRLPSYAQ